MSYILDALRRADAERSRGAVPGLHAQGLPADLEPAARDYRPLIWAAGGAGVLLVAVIVILLVAPWKGVQVPATESRATLSPAPDLAPSPRDAAAASAPAQLAQGELPAPQPGAIEPAARPVEPPIGRGTPPPAATADAGQGQPYPPRATGANTDHPPQGYPPADGRGAPAYPPPQTPRPSPRDSPADRAAAGQVATQEPRAASPDSRAAARTPVPATAQARAPAQGPAAAPVEHYGAPLASTAAPAAANTRVPNVNDLPPSVRATLPHLAVGGAIYSETPSARMVILNGQVFHEGEKPAADTVLEQIRLKSAILNFRGQRYEISF